ncbi:MAG: hypothetical protein Kow0092_16660 [Deferrisomatales bacterium]
MTRRIWRLRRPTTVLAALLLCGVAVEGKAAIRGIAAGTGTMLHWAVRSDHISTADGGSVHIWGYASLDANVHQVGRAQYPGPTVIVTQGETVTIELLNDLKDVWGNPVDQKVSIVFHGQNVTATGGDPGLLTREASFGDTVTYSFVAEQPGTYLYESGTNPQLQVEMGLLGALIVRPAGYAAGAGPFNVCVDNPGCTAYGDPATRYDREYLFFLTEIDPEVHNLVEFGDFDAIDLTRYFPVYWFINGRAAPDTLGPPDANWLPTQPYNIVPRMRPGEKLLMRMVGGSRDQHPYHHHGNHARIVARDGRLLRGPAGEDLSHEVFTISVVPGETVDAIFTWTGAEMGWDIYGTPADGRPAHTCGDPACPDGNADGFDDGTGAPCFDAATHEYCPDHGKPFPVVLPGLQDLAFGGFWSGSPFLGTEGALPPGEGGLNPNSAFTFMWHSHTEKELINFDIFPGGMLTMLFVEPPTVMDIP